MRPPLTFDSDSETSTDHFAVTCASSVTEGLTIALNGELGSGKTRFVRAFCQGLGIESSRVTSPTFVLMQLYQGTRWSVVHFDTYRLADADEFLALGADEYLLDPHHICLIEWAGRVDAVLPHDHLRVEISQTGLTQRRFELWSRGPVSAELVERVRIQLDPD